jgi:hypothetical protein
MSRVRVPSLPPLHINSGMSTFSYDKVGQYGNEVVTYIEKNKGVIKANDGQEYTIAIDNKSTFNTFAKYVKTQNFIAAEKLVREKEFEVLEPDERKKKYVALGWTEIEKSVFSSKSIKIDTKQQEKITLLIIKNVLGDDTKTWKSFDEMFNANNSNIKKIFPDLPKLTTWYDHFDLQFRQITSTPKFPNSSYGVYLYDDPGSFMDYISELVTEKLGLFSKKDSWDPADIWLVKSKNVQEKYTDKFDKILDKFTEGFYAKNKFRSIKEINAILKEAYFKKDIVGISLKKSNMKTLKYTEFNLQANVNDQKLPDVAFDSIDLDVSYDDKKGFISKTSYVNVMDNDKDSYKLAFKSNTGEKIGNITYEFLPSSNASAFLGKVPKDQLQRWLVEQIKLLGEDAANVYMPQGSKLTKTYNDKIKKSWVNKVDTIKKNFGDFTGLNDFVENLEKSYEDFGLSVKNASAMQMVDFTWILAKLQENKNLTKFLTLSYYFAQKKGQIYNFGPFGKLY